MNESAMELVQLAVDHALTPSQQAELEALLSRSPEARDSLAAMRELSRRIESAPLVEPLHPVRDEVMAALRNRSIPVVSIGARRTRRRRLVAYAWAAAAALLILVIVYPIASGHRTEVSPAHAGATMTSTGPGSWPVIARASARRAGQTITLRIRRSGDELAVEPEIHPQQEVAVTIRWNPSQMEPLDFTSGKLDDDGDHTPNSATFRESGAGPRRLLLRLRPGAAGSSEVTALSGGGELVKVSIELN